MQDLDAPDQHFTLSVMQWAQFVDHDFAHTPFKDPLECCEGNRVPPVKRHRYCDPIEIFDDQFFNPMGVFCMNYVRSMLGLNEDCVFGHAEQVC